MNIGTGLVIGFMDKVPVRNEVCIWYAIEV